MSARDEIITAAEHLFATQGIDAMSLREINRVAGQRNVTALQYHFGDREGLLLAIVQRHMAIMSARIHACLDRLDGAAESDCTDVMTCLVDPMLSMVDESGGADFLQIAGQLLNRTTTVPVDMENPRHVLIDDGAGSLTRWAQHMAVHMDESATGSPLHQRFTVMRFAYLEIARRVGDPEGVRPGVLFRSHLLDLLVALARAQPSSNTRALLAGRRRRPQD
jgi:AcrR family transcriptional regulator